MSQRLRDLIESMNAGERYWLIAGRRIPIIAGGDGSDGGSGDSGDGGDDGGEGEGEGEGEGGGDGGDSGGSEGDDDKGKTGKRSAEEERQAREREEAERKTKARIRAADKRAAEAEKKLKEVQESGKPELEKLNGRLAESESEVTRLRGVNRELALKVAILSNSEHDWSDRDTMLLVALRDLSDVEVEDDGSVDEKEVAKALAGIAQSKPHLVRQKGKSGDDGVKGGKRGGTGGDGQVTPELLSAFPALRSRNVQPPR